MELKKQIFLIFFLFSCIGLPHSKTMNQDVLRIQKPLKTKETKKANKKNFEKILNKDLPAQPILSDQESTKNKEKKINKRKLSPALNQTTKKEKTYEEKTDKKIETKKSALYEANLSGTKKKLIKSHLKNIISPFPNEKEIEFIISTYLLKKSKKEDIVCPSGYDLQNNHSLYGELTFINVRKNSCLGKESKEIYYVTKKWPIKKSDKKNLILTYHQILNWMLNLFFYSYITASLKTPPKEFKEYKLDQACPSCSFRFEYNYRHDPSGFVYSDVKAICMDKRYTFSKVKQDNYMVNNWNCVKRP